jgi:hypothetical protein
MAKFLLLVFAALLLGSTEAIAGPPFRTDDPVPVALGHYELYTAAIGTYARGGPSGGLPNVELTYGLIPNGQLQIGGELAFDSTGNGPVRWGYGDTELSFKYRIVQEDKNGLIPQVAVFPAVFFPTGDQHRGLGAGHVTGFLPVWAQKSFGKWTTYGGGGYWINQDEKTGDRNYWFFGWLLQRKITEQLTLGGEIFHQTPDTLDGKDSTGFNLGGAYDFDEHNHLLFSAGTGLQNTAQTNEVAWYFGWEMTY